MKHAYRDGRLEEVVLRHLSAEDGQTVIVKNIRSRYDFSFHSIIFFPSHLLTVPEFFYKMCLCMSSGCQISSVICTCDKRTWFAGRKGEFLDLARLSLSVR